jgi:hypothetical protein
MHGLAQFSISRIQPLLQARQVLRGRLPATEPGFRDREIFSVGLFGINVRNIPVVVSYWLAVAGMTF